MDALGEPYQRLARHNKLGGTVQAAARMLDSTAASASHLIRQHPLARLGVFAYFILVHVFLYLLILHMHHTAIAPHGGLVEAGGLPGVGLPAGAGGAAADGAAAGRRLFL
jgi:hypothetical protein